MLRRRADNRGARRGSAGQRLRPGQETGRVGGTSVAQRDFEILEQKNRPATDQRAPDERVERLVALGSALSDPIRVRMLGMMAAGRGCCDFVDLGVPASEEDTG